MTDKRPPERRSGVAAGEVRVDEEAVAKALVTLPPAFSPRTGMTPGRWKFANEYILDMDATAAYARAFPDAGNLTCRAEGPRLLTVPAVVEEIQRLLDVRATVTGITADRVLMRAWEIATADVRELVDVEVGACRFCWGMYNQYQYTEAEFSSAQDKHIREQAKKAREEPGYEAKPFPEKGGTGYDPKRPPSPECPSCWGDGHGRIRVKDTRKLSPGAAALFAGVKQDKHGNISVVIEDRSAYLTLVARYLGMDKRVLEGNPDNPLYVLLQQIQQSNASLGVVVQDPEAERTVDVQARVLQKSAPGAVSGKSPWRAT